jgi:hypothetical protein
MRGLVLGSAQSLPRFGSRKSAAAEVPTAYSKGCERSSQKHNAYSDEQEQEADWHAAALLLPRDALVHHRSRGKTTLEIANHFGVSVALCEWRLRMTGVEIQIRRSHG